MGRRELQNAEIESHIDMAPKIDKFKQSKMQSLGEKI